MVERNKHQLSWLTDPMQILAARSSKHFDYALASAPVKTKRIVMAV